MNNKIIKTKKRITFLNKELIKGLNLCYRYPTIKRTKHYRPFLIEKDIKKLLEKSMIYLEKQNPLNYERIKNYKEYMDFENELFSLHKLINKEVDIDKAILVLNWLERLEHVFYSIDLDSYSEFVDDLETHEYLASLKITALYLINLIPFTTEVSKNKKAIKVYETIMNRIIMDKATPNKTYNDAISYVLMGNYAFFPRIIPRLIHEKITKINITLNTNTSEIIPEYVFLNSLLTSFFVYESNLSLKLNDKEKVFWQRLSNKNIEKKFQEYPDLFVEEIRIFKDLSLKIFK
jgi:hypothetical protein